MSRDRPALKEWLRERRITEVELLVPDMAGIARGKILPTSNRITSYNVCYTKLLRNVAGPQLPLPIAAVSTAAWSDETHVEENRTLYAAKFDLAKNRLGNRFGFRLPDGGFFLWLDVGDGVEAATKLWLV